MAEATFTLRVDADLKEEFTRAARSMDRSAAQLVRDFMRDVVRRENTDMTYDEWFHKQTERGLEAVRLGRVIPHEVLAAKAEERRKRLRAIAEQHGQIL